MAKGDDIGRKTALWRREWQSMQWVLLSLLNADAFESMNILCTTHQTSIDVAPYFITYNINEAKKILSEDIQLLDTLIQIMSDHLTKQFIRNYSLKTSHLEVTTKHFSEIMHFQWGPDNDLTFNNLFTDL